MASKFGAPYREPCGGWPATPRRWIRSHKRTADAAIGKWTNITKMRDYSDLGAFIPAYAIDFDDCSGASCVPVTCGGAGEKPCYPFDAAYWMGPCNAGPGEIVSQVLDNCYKQDGTLDRSVCRKVGFKNVQAARTWHGMPGFLRCSCDPISVKYLAIKMTGRYTYAGSLDASSEYISSYSVNATSGIISQTSCSHTYSGNEENEVQFRSNSYYLARQRYSCDQWTGCDAPSGAEDVTEYNSKSLSNSSQLTLNGSPPSGLWTAALNRATDTVLESSVVFDAGSGDTITLYTKTELTVENRLSDVIDDMLELAALWDMADDVVYPWRTDTDCALAPLVCRKERPSPVSPDVGPQSCDAGYNDTGDYDGTILGAPLPAGYVGFWDKDHANYCDRTGGVCVQTYGAMSGTGSEPASATKWTDGLWSRLLRPGAWIEYGTPDLNSTPVFDQIRMQKWAETLLSWESINFARPCGIDRGLLDSDASECIVAYSAPTLDLEADIAVTGTELFAVESTIHSIAPGIYNCTRPGTAQLTLGDLLYAIPAWMEFQHDEKVNKLRWFTKRGICSTLNVISAVQTAANEVTVTVDGDCYFFGQRLTDHAGGEAIDFTDVDGLTTQEVISATSLRVFKCTGTLSGTYAGGGTVICTGYDATDDKWNDDNPKRDYIQRSWNQAGTLTETQACKFPAVCAPTVLCISPNTESFEHADVYAMPTGLTVDECTTSTLQADFLQVETDPFWKVPPAPCSGAWTSDDGTCLDSATHYPHGPLIEPRLTLPSGAPALASGITLHTAGTQPGPGVCSAPWTQWLAFEGQTCNGYNDWWRGC